MLVRKHLRHTVVVATNCDVCPRRSKIAGVIILLLQRVFVKNLLTIVGWGLQVELYFLGLIPVDFLD